MQKMVQYCLVTWQGYCLVLKEEWVPYSCDWEWYCSQSNLPFVQVPTPVHPVSISPISLVSLHPLPTSWFLFLFFQCLVPLLPPLASIYSPAADFISFSLLFLLISRGIPDVGSGLDVCKNGAPWTKTKGGFQYRTTRQW